MIRAVAGMLLALAGLLCEPATACSLVRDAKASTERELADSSALVFLARVKQVRSHDPDQAGAQQRTDTGDEQFYVPAIAPVALADFSLIRSLKGEVPLPALLRNATDGCGLLLEADTDYLIFAERPVIAGNGILPLRGSFKLDGKPVTQAKLSQIKAHLLSQTH